MAEIQRSRESEVRDKGKQLDFASTTSIFSDMKLMCSCTDILAGTVYTDRYGTRLASLLVVLKEGVIIISYIYNQNF